MKVVRIYTGLDGESHFEDLDMPFEKVEVSEQSAMETASGIQFVSTPPGVFKDWHNALRRQYVITLEGQWEIGVGDGTKRMFYPGDVFLADDHTGRGHTFRIHGNEARVAATVPC